jgi:hypothetical protein
MFCYRFVAPLVPWDWQFVTRIEALDHEWKPAGVATIAILVAGFLHVFNDSIIKWYRCGSKYLKKGLNEVLTIAEEYPLKQYGIHTKTLWPRFVARLASDHAATIDDARILFNVTLHFSFLSLLTAALLVLGAAIYPIPFIETRLTIWFFACLATVLLFAWIFYKAAVTRAKDWGQTVGTVFDLHRRNVLRDLGIKYPPADLAGERALWKHLSYLLGSSERCPTLLQFETGSFIDPPNPNLTMTRGITPADANRRTITIRIAKASKEALGIFTVIEYLPPSHKYIWNSANVSNVTGCNPYCFRIESLQDKVEISYSVLVDK